MPDSAKLPDAEEFPPELLGYVRLNKPKEALSLMGVPADTFLLPDGNMVLFVWKSKGSISSGAKQAVQQLPMALFVSGDPTSASAKSLAEWIQKGVGPHETIEVKSKALIDASQGMYLLWGGAKRDWLLGRVANYIRTMSFAGSSPLPGEHCQSMSSSACLYLNTKALFPASGEPAPSSGSFFAGVLHSLFGTKGENQADLPLVHHVGFMALDEIVDFLRTSEFLEVSVSVQGDHVEVTFGTQSSLQRRGPEVAQRIDLMRFLPTETFVRFQMKPVAAGDETQVPWALLRKVLQSHSPKQNLGKLDVLWETLMRQAEGMSWAGTFSGEHATEPTLLLVLAPVWHPEPPPAATGEEEDVPLGGKMEYIPPDDAAKKMLSALYDVLDELSVSEEGGEKNTWKIKDVRKRKKELFATWTHLDRKLPIEAEVVGKYVVLRVGEDAKTHAAVVKTIKVAEREIASSDGADLSASGSSHGEIHVQALVRARSGMTETKSKEALSSLPAKESLISWTLGEHQDTQIMRVRIPLKLLAACKLLVSFLPSKPSVPSSSQ